MARTGSGKTAAFLVPMFERLKAPQAKTGARAVILTPTRELALQTMKFTKEVGSMSAAFLLTSHVFEEKRQLTVIFSVFCSHSWGNLPASKLPWSWVETGESHALMLSLPTLQTLSLGSLQDGYIISIWHLSTSDWTSKKICSFPVWTTSSLLFMKTPTCECFVLSLTMLSPFTLHYSHDVMCDSPQNHWYSWSSDARNPRDEPEAAKCGVRGVWRGRQVRSGIWHLKASYLNSNVRLICVCVWLWRCSSPPSAGCLKWVSPSSFRKSSGGFPRPGRLCCSPPRCPSCWWSLPERVRFQTAVCPDVRFVHHIKLLEVIAVV